MKIYATRSCAHVAKELGHKRGKVEVYNKRDGELYLRLIDKPDSKTCVIGSFPSPAENLVELCLLLNALCKTNTKVSLIITYFGYARQDIAFKPGESVGIEVMVNMLKQFNLRVITIIHPHSLKIHNLLPCKTIIPFFDTVVNDNEVIVAPDIGAAQETTSITERYGLSVAYIEKVRSPKVRAIKLFGGVAGKRVLVVDDIIDTGETVIEAAKLLLSKGAISVDVYATHGIFSNNALERLNKSNIRHITVTNTIMQTNLKNSNIGCLSISPVINKIISG